MPPSYTQWLAECLHRPVPAAGSPDQPRDDKGRFSSGGGTETPADAEAARQWAEKAGLSNWRASLPPDEQAAVKGYTVADSSWMNRNARKGTEDKLTPPMRAQTEALERALERGTLKEPVTVERYAYSRELAEAARPGAVLTDPGYMSTTASHDYAEKHWTGEGTAGPGKVRFQINVPAGAKGGWIDSSESELLLQRGGSLHVTRVEPDGDGKRVWADYRPRAGKSSPSAAGWMPHPQAQAAAQDGAIDRFGWRDGDLQIVPR